MAYQRWWKTVRDQQGNAVNGASCAIYNGGTGTLATVYDPNTNDSAPGGLSNPFTTTASGVFGFMAADGEYDVQISGGNGATQQYRVALNAANINISSDLASTTDPLKGAGLVGLNDDLPYATGTVGAKAQYAQTASAQMQAMLSKIKRNVEDVTILILGDSTGDGADRWPNQLALQLPAMFPTHTIKYTTWNSTVYNAPTTIATGTGAQTITVYNGSVSGAHTVSPLGGRWAAMVAGVPTPDLTFINYGHNEGTVATGWRSDYLSLTESVMDTCPGTSVVMILQNPSTVGTYQAQRNSVYEKLAAQRGFGTINVWQAFIDYGPTWTTDLMADTVHPNAAGSLLWTAQVVSSMKFSRYNSPKPSMGSLVNVGGRQIVINGDFSQWTGTTPDGWIAYNGSPTISKDTTNYENPNGYGLKVVATGGVQCSIATTIPWLGLRDKWVTILARVYIPIGAPYTAGVIGINDGFTTTSSVDNGAGADPGGAFKWVVVSKKFSASATSGLLLFYGDQSSTNSSATLDHISVVVGDTPYGLPRMMTNQPAYVPSLGGGATSIQFQTQVFGQAYPSFYQTADGSMYWGTGAAPAAKWLRYGGGNLTCDVGFVAVGASYVLNTLTVSYALTSLRGIQVQGKAFTANGATTTFTYPANTRYQYITTSAASLATTLPATSAALDGAVITLVAGSAVATATWVAGTGGATIVGAPAALVANSPVRMIYHHATTSWYPY